MEIVEIIAEEVRRRVREGEGEIFYSGPLASGSDLILEKNRNKGEGSKASDLMIYVISKERGDDPDVAGADGQILF
jgi:hypothetical protein